MPIAVQFPTSDVSITWMPQDDNFVRVADDDDGTYNATSDTGDEDRFGFPALPAEATGINSVALLWRPSSVSGDHSAAVRVWLGVSSTTGTTRNLTTSVVSHFEPTLARPGGGSWSVADVNAATYGYALLGGSAFSDARVHRLVRFVDYATAPVSRRGPVDVSFPPTAHLDASFGETATADFPPTANASVDFPPVSGLDTTFGLETSPSVEFAEDEED